MTPTESIGLFCAGSLVTLVALLALAWSRVSGFRVELGGLRLVDRDNDESARGAYQRTMSALSDTQKERDEARREAERMRDLLESNGSRR
jgi:hypothetical protein